MDSEPFIKRPVEVMVPMSDDYVLYGVIESKAVLKKEMERLGWFPAVVPGTDYPEFVREDWFYIDGELQYESVSLDRFWRLIQKHRYVVEEDGPVLQLRQVNKPHVISKRELEFRSTNIPIGGLENWIKRRKLKWHSRFR